MGIRSAAGAGDLEGLQDPAVKDGRSKDEINPEDGAPWVVYNAVFERVAFGLTVDDLELITCREQKR